MSRDRLRPFSVGRTLAQVCVVITEFPELSDQVIAAAIEVHRVLGPGLLESAYSRCLAVELEDRGIPFEREVSAALIYKNRRLEHGFRADFVVDNRLLIEIKCVLAMHPVYKAQVITYLRLLGLKRGLLLNFHGRRLSDGLVSVVV